MFQYDQVETAVVNRLATTLADFAVVKELPENTKDIDTLFKQALGGNKTMILVAYTGSDFDQSGSINIISQNENVNILLNLQSNKLRGNNGIYNVISLVKKQIQGFKFTNGSRFRLKSVDYDDRNVQDGLFSYNVVFTVSKLQVQDSADGDDDITGNPLLKNVSFEEEAYGQ
jgi:hypothetical protein